MDPRNNEKHQTEDPIARALGYPYPRHPGPVLFDPGSGAQDATIIDIGPERETVLPGLIRPLPVRAVAVRTANQTIEINDAVALIAAGSNGSTIQLARKYRDRRFARPTLIAPAAVQGAISVYSAHITSYGSVPATMHPAQPEDASGPADLQVLLLPAEELAHINSTEALGVNYVLAAPDGVAAVVGDVTIARPLAYVSKRGALSLDGAPVMMPETGGGGPDLSAAPQREMIVRVQRHVGDTGRLESFIRSLIADVDRRKQVTSQLAENGRRWTLAQEEIVADGSVDLVR